MRCFALKHKRADDQAPLAFVSFELICLVCIFLDLVNGHFQARDTILRKRAAAAGEVLAILRSISGFLRSLRVRQVSSLRLQS